MAVGDYLGIKLHAARDEKIHVSAGRSAVYILSTGASIVRAHLWQLPVADVISYLWKGIGPYVNSAGVIYFLFVP